MHMRMFSPTSINHAANLAKLHEYSQPSSHQPPSRFSNFPKCQGILLKPIISSSNNSTKNTLRNNSSNPLLVPTYKPNPQHFNRTYFAAEMEEHRSKGLLMFCDQQFTLGHQFKYNRSQLMVLELDDENQV
ncbi:unnamed protein product [Vicia faba]|uniref:Uncharacterized protein n=1 Tax=Vicia faba TaxID=3906 RepID=A0AAV0Z8H3_VICFA|nr:unnamed protein product [Vicia faba]